MIPIRTAFKSSANLKSILCQNKSKLLPNFYPEVTCSCQLRYPSKQKRKFYPVQNNINKIVKKGNGIIQVQ